MKFGTAALSGAADWNSRALLGLDKPTWPDIASPRVRIGDVAFVDRMPNGSVRKGSLAILSVDSDTGQPVASAVERSMPTWTFGGERGLTPGCVLVHPSSARPAILLTAEHAKRSFASRFIPVRPDPAKVLPEYLWALLSSSAGRDSRQRLSTGSRHPVMAADLAGLEIPLPSVAEQQRVATVARAIASELQIRIDKPTPSWAKTAALLDEPRWDLLVKFRDLSVFDAGTPLGELGRVRRSRSQSRSFSERPLPGWLPVIEPRAIRDPRSTRWAEPSQDSVQPGDIVIPPHPNLDAIVAVEPSVVGNQCLVVRPHSNPDIARIAGSLNSATGRDLRRALSGPMRPLAPQDAARIPINDGIPPGPAPTEPLSQELEELLWQ